jgi:hypothetical protein
LLLHTKKRQSACCKRNKGTVCRQLVAPKKKKSISSARALTQRGSRHACLVTK